MSSVVFDGGRTAKINRNADGEAVGLAIFLGADELEHLGVDALSSREVRYQICDGELVIGR